MLQRGDVVVATWGHNRVLDRAFSFLYEFGYYTTNGCIVYKQGECNMQDAKFFKVGEIRPATDEDKRNLFWGI